MQMKALRSANFAKLSSSNSTSDEYWDGSMSAGTPAGYCLSQIRSMVFPLRSISPVRWDGRLILGSIEQAGRRWQAAGQYRRIVAYGRERSQGDWTRVAALTSWFGLAAA